MKRLFLGIIICFFFFIACTQVPESKEKKISSPDSLYTLGEFYLNEDTDKPKYDSAEYYLEKASLLNHSKALYVLGEEYIFGSKLARDTGKGSSYLRKAAELGDTYAYLALGKYYYSLSDLIETKKNLEIGVEKGNKYAAYELYMLYYNGYAFGRPEKENKKQIDERKGFDYLLRAAEMGSLDAQLALVYLYAKGKQGLLEADIKKAKYYFELAEKNPEAQEVPGATDELEIAKKELNF